MPKSAKSKTARVRKANTSGPRPRRRAAPRADEGKLIAVLERVAPFFFHRKKRGATPPSLNAGKPAAAKKSAPPLAAKRSRSKTAKKKASRGRAARASATIIEARKRMSPTKGGSKKTETSSLEIDDNEEAATAAASVEAKAKAGKKSAGFILLPEEEKKIDADAMKTQLLADAEDDAFLGKVVQSAKAGSSPLRKAGSWSLLKSRFLGRGKSSVPELADAKGKAPPMTDKEQREDGFLKRVQKKSINAVVGTAVDPDEIAAQKLLDEKRKNDTALEELASGGEAADPASIAKKDDKRPVGRILSAAELQKESKQAKEAALRLEKEVKEIKEEMRAKQKSREKDIEEIDKKTEAKKQLEPTQTPTPVVKKKQNMQHKSGLQRFFAGLSHFGLGKERMHFIQNMATMLNAGLPLIDSLKTLQLETRSKPMRKLLQQILDAVENGSPLWRAMEAQNFFSLHALALIRIGEEAGNLAQNVEYLAQQEEKDHELKSKVKMAMIYPTIVMMIMFVIVIGLGWFVLPNLIGVLYSLNVELPFITRMVILFTNMFTQYGAIVVPSSIGFFIFMIILAKYTPLRGAFQWVMFRIPGIGALATDATIARFGVILGGLLKAGVPVIEAMQSLVEVTPIVSYRKLYTRLLERISIGDSFSKSFGTIKGSQKLLPPSVQQLVITGEKSGALADIMLKIADIYDKKASETAQKLPVILEPMLLLVIGGLVGTIAFAIIVPIYSIVGNVGR